MIRVLVADDHTIVREGLKQILAKSGDMVVAGEAANGNELLRMVRDDGAVENGRWDVLVTDMSMPGRNGLELIRMVKDIRPRLPVLVLSMYGEEQFAVRAIRAGASGYLNKESASEQLVGAIRKIAGGGVHVSPAVAEVLFLSVRDGGDGGKKLPHEQLSNREFQVLRLIADGNSINDIAKSLNLSAKTVSTHKARILEKMKLANQAELIRYALEHQLASLPPAPQNDRK